MCAQELCCYTTKLDLERFDSTTIRAAEALEQEILQGHCSVKVLAAPLMAPPSKKVLPAAGPAVATGAAVDLMHQAGEGRLAASAATDHSPPPALPHTALDNGPCQQGESGSSSMSNGAEDSADPTAPALPDAGAPDDASWAPAAECGDSSCTGSQGSGAGKGAAATDPPPLALPPGDAPADAARACQQQQHDGCNGGRAAGGVRSFVRAAKAQWRRCRGWFQALRRQPMVAPLALKEAPHTIPGDDADLPTGCFIVVEMMQKRWWGGSKGSAVATD
jgi:hypothetical protein